MITKLLIGTGNPMKFANYKKYFVNSGIELISTKDLGITEEPQETGTTMEANAILKAKYYNEKSGMPTLADDAGFEIPALNNFPGVNSKRFAGHEMTDDEIINGILEKMKELKGDQRKATMKLSLALALDQDHVYTANGSLSGHVPEQPNEKRFDRFPYRSLLFVDALNKWSIDMTPEESEKLGYRGAAVTQLKKYLE